MQIRPAEPADAPPIWAMLEPVLRAGETYALPREWTREQALGWWFGEDHEVRVAVVGHEVAGCYYLHANQRGPGGHIANCGYVTASGHTGSGVATTMCLDSLERARERGFRAMQFNLVVSTNTRAVELWRRLGFTTVGVIPGGFEHPRLGDVDAFVMHRRVG